MTLSPNSVTWRSDLFRLLRDLLESGNLTDLAGLPLAARQILQTDENGALKAIALAANKTLRTDANANIVLANVEKPLLAAYGGDDINGLSQIIFDVPDEYVGAEIDARGVATQSGSGILSFRWGPSGGSLLTSYTIRNWNQYGTNDLTTTLDTGVSAAQVVEIVNGPTTFVKASFSFGSPTTSAFCLVDGMGWTPGGGWAKTSRAIAGESSGIMRRIAIVSTVPFGNDPETSIRIYGVR